MSDNSDDVSGSGMTYHAASVVVWGSVPQADAVRFASLMSRQMSPAEVAEARAVYEASGAYDPTCEVFFFNTISRDLSREPLRRYLWPQVAARCGR